MTHSVIFSHGFEGKPTGSKPQFMREQGYDVHALNLYEHGIEIPAMINIITKAMQHNPEAILVGSSMGGLCTALAASRSPIARRIILLAPAFECTNLFREKAGEAFALWQQLGSLPYYHKGLEQEVDLSFSFYQDLEQYCFNFRFHTPHQVHIIHGVQDESIQFQASQRVVQASAQDPDPVNVHLTLVEAGHRLGEAVARQALVDALKSMHN